MLYFLYTSGQGHRLLVQDMLQDTSYQLDSQGSHLQRRLLQNRYKFPLCTCEVSLNQVDRSDPLDRFCLCRSFLLCRSNSLRHIRDNLIDRLLVSQGCRFLLDTRLRSLYKSSCRQLVDTKNLLDMGTSHALPTCRHIPVSNLDSL